jgi:hypothetical protein
MTGEEWALAATVYCSGLGAGFLGGLATIIRPMQAAMDGRGFRSFIEALLPVAKHGVGGVFNFVWSGATFLLAILALVLLWDDPGSTSFVLTAIGLAVVLVGVIIVSNVWKTPTYKMILALNPDDLPPDWEAVRRRYFAINWLQFAANGVAFALFLGALIAL